MGGHVADMCVGLGLGLGLGLGAGLVLGSRDGWTRGGHVCWMGGGYLCLDPGVGDVGEHDVRQVELPLDIEAACSPNTDTASDSKHHQHGMHACMGG